MTDLTIEVNKPYHFTGSVRDYGWVVLHPCAWVDEYNALQRVERLESGRVVLLHLSATETEDKVRVNIEVKNGGPLTEAEQAEIIAKVRWMLRLDEDFAEFYAMCAGHPVLEKRAQEGRGRLLRSPSVWEDCIKTILTTNTTWLQTKGMVQRLVSLAGDPLPDDSNHRAFPTPAKVADLDETFLQEQVRMGYRGPYVMQLAREIVEGKRDLEGLKHANLPPKELKKELKGIKGIGDYAAHTMLMMLGHYEEVAVDTELRSFVIKRYFNGQSAPDKELAAVYDRWGRWKYLAYWLDGTE